METSNSSQFIEKRAATRYPVALFVEFENGGGWTRDVSATGVCIETDQPLACGVSIRFFMNQPEPQGWGTKVQCSGSVVRVEQTGDSWRIGILMEAVHFEG
ncbi:MAG: PilZ domain-containing protein [Methylomicrobium sp.]